LVLQKILQ